MTIVEVALGSPTGHSLFIRESTPPSGTTSCHISSYWHYTLSLDTALGKSMYAALLAAAAAQQSVNLAGLGQCNEWNDTESLRTVGVRY